MENICLESANASISIDNDHVEVIKHPSQNVEIITEFNFTDIKTICFHVPDLFSKGHVKFIFKQKIKDSKDNNLASLQIPYEQSHANAYHIMARKLAKESKIMLIQE